MFSFPQWRTEMSFCIGVKFFFKNYSQKIFCSNTFSFPSFPFFLSFGRFFLKNLQTHQTQKEMVRPTNTEKYKEWFILHIFSTNFIYLQQIIWYYHTFVICNTNIRVRSQKLFKDYLAVGYIARNPWLYSHELDSQNYMAT